MHLLDQEAPGLAQRLQFLPPTARRAILVKSCLRAATALANLDSQTLELLNAIQSRGELSKQEAQSALALAEASDDKYFALAAKQAPADAWLRVFCEARLLKAMAIVFEAAPGEGPADVIYELSKTTEDPSPLLKFVDSEIDLASRATRP